MFRKGPEEGSGVSRLPSGSFTIDAAGKVAVSTLPRAFPEAKLRQISDLVLGTFQAAREAHIPITELVVHFGALRLSARELRGGAIIFLAPRAFQ